MGARESSRRDGAENPSLEVDHYQLLQVKEDASADEIKASLSTLGLHTSWPMSIQRSFRRLALIHHPDKNQADIEGATQKFADLQRAYEAGFISIPKNEWPSDIL